MDRLKGLPKIGIKIAKNPDYFQNYSWMDGYYSLKKFLYWST